MQAARQPGYGKRVQLIPDGMHDPMAHMEAALKLQHPFNKENVLKPDHCTALERMSAIEAKAIKERMKTLGHWKTLANSKDILLRQQEHESLASDCAKKSWLLSDERSKRNLNGVSWVNVKTSCWPCPRQQL